MLLTLIPSHTGIAQASDFGFSVGVTVNECDGVTPIHRAYVEVQFDNGRKWHFYTDAAGQVHEIVVPGSYGMWRLGVDGLWSEWTSSTWVDESVNICWVHLPFVQKS